MTRITWLSPDKPITATQQRDIERMARQLRAHLLWEEQYEYEAGSEDHITNKAERQYLARALRCPLYFLTRRQGWAWK
jgi:hypothetical protein